MSNRSSFVVGRASMAAAAIALSLFLALPVFSLLLGGLHLNFGAALRHPYTWPSLRLSLLATTASVAIVVVCGTPLSFFLASLRPSAARSLETILHLPIVLPPAVAGVALLTAFGRQGLIGGLFSGQYSLAFSTTAVVLAEIFVAGPLYVQTATSSFSLIDPDILAVAKTMGASFSQLFFRVAVPLSWPGLRAGMGLCAARALGEFGATLMFAGNLPGATQTMPSAIYSALETDFNLARVLSILLLSLSVVVLLLTRGLSAGSRFLLVGRKDEP